MDKKLHFPVVTMGEYLFSLKTRIRVCNAFNTVLQ